METVAKLQSLSFTQGRTYAFAALFAAGNIALPQLVHLIPGGGLIWLPIYFLDSFDRTIKNTLKNKEGSIIAKVLCLIYGV